MSKTDEIRPFLGTFDGHYMGGVAIATARGEKHAQKMIARRLKNEHHLDVKPDKIKVQEITVEKQQAVIVADGDY